MKKDNILKSIHPTKAAKNNHQLKPKSYNDLSKRIEEKVTDRDIKNAFDYCVPTIA